MSTLKVKIIYLSIFANQIGYHHNLFSSECSDFYSYSCVSPAFNHSIKDIKPFESISKREVESKIKEYIKKELNKPYLPTNEVYLDDNFKYVKDFYNSCIDPLRKEKNEVSYPQKVLKEIEYASNIGILRNRFNPLQSPYFNIRLIVNEKNEKIIYITNSSIKSRLELTTPELSNELDAFFNIIFSGNKDKSKFMKYKIMEIEDKYEEYRNPEIDDSLKINDIIDISNITNVESLKEIYKNLNFSYILNKIPDDTKVFIDKDYNKNLNKLLLDKNSLEAVSLVNELFFDIYNNNFSYNFKENSINDNNLIEDKCVNQIVELFPNTVSYQVIKNSNKLSSIDKKNVSEIAENIKESLVGIIKNLDLNLDLKSKLEEKVRNVEFKIAYNDLNIWNFENYYNIFSSDYLEKKVSILNQKKENLLKEMNFINSDNYWFGSPLKSKVTYFGIGNKLFINFGVLMHPYYSDKYKLRNYSRLGNLIAHELSHSIDSTNLQLFVNKLLEDNLNPLEKDEYLGNYYEIINEFSLKPFVNFKKKYKGNEDQKQNVSNYEINKKLSDIKDLNISRVGLNQINEINADYLSLKVSYNAAKNAGLIINKRDAKDFFINFSRNHCLDSYNNNKELESYLVEKNFSKKIIYSMPNHYQRLKNHTQMSKEFNEAFECKQNLRK